LIWLVAAPYGRHLRADRPRATRAVRGFADIVETAREVRLMPVLAAMISLAAGVSFLVGNSYHAQMPELAGDLGYGDPGFTYSMLLGADAAGALLGGVLLELRGGLFRMEPRSAALLAAAW